MWVCVCECGNTIQTTGTNLRSGNSRSCGCLHKQALAQRVKLAETYPIWEADMALYKRKLEYRRKRRTLGSNQFSPPVEEVPPEVIPWALTLEEYTALVTQPCFYCGLTPQQKVHGAAMSGFKKNGIDRVDNSAGYTTDNCVSCCCECNRAKRALTVATFIETTRRRYEHLVTKGLIVPTKPTPPSVSSLEIVQRSRVRMSQP